MKKNSKHFRKCTALFLGAALLVTGCQKAAPSGGEAASGEQKTTESKSTQAAVDNAIAAGNEEELITALKAKYNAGVIDYSGETLHIDRNESVQIKIGYNPWYEAPKTIFDSFVVYQDAELKHPLDVAGYDWDADSGMLTIEPPVYGPAGYIYMDTEQTSSFQDTDDTSGWGSLPQLYLASYVDAETGKPLEGNPLVTVLKVNAEIEQTPQVTFSQDDSGSARFSWKAVPGADEYLLFRIKKQDGALDGYMNMIASTTDTQWTVEQTLDMDGSSAIVANDVFRQYLMMGEDLEELKEAGYTDTVEWFGVIAVNAEGSSHISNLFDGNELAHMLPFSIAHIANEEDMGYTAEGTANLPATMGITMCDGSISQRIIEYDKDSIVKTEDSFFYQIEGKAAGTPFSTSFLVTDQNWDTLNQELETIEVRQEKLKNKGGNVETSISIMNGEDSSKEPDNMEETSPKLETDDNTTEENMTETDEEVTTKADEDETESTEDETESTEDETESTEDDIETTETVTETTERETESEEPETTEKETKGNSGQTISGNSEYGNITANSALSEYLAIQMLNTKEEIDISAFKEAADTALVVDAFLEAQYQNPLILGIKEVGMDTANSILYVDYDYDTQTTKEKQEEIKEKVAEITNEIITDGMSDLDKELAINQYLCANGEYDDAALENATENNFQYVDDIYNDSFTAYGILVNGVGVCASYSAGFKLLADAAGLDSIVVTGYLEGNLPHAWNKVKLDNQWNVVDSTNNDNEVIQNALFNLSDSSSSSVLAEDERFALDSNLYDYEAPSDDNEFYRIMDNYFSMDDITSELAAKLQTDGSVMLRTDYTLDDESFHTIAQEAANTIQANISGFHWMGVIHLEQR